MTDTILPPVQKKQVKLVTNLNGKLSCQSFIHIQIAGKSGVPEHVLDTFITEFSTQDNSHDPVQAKIYDSFRLLLKDIQEWMTQLSHGITKQDFIIKLIEKMPEVRMDTEIVIYCYKKI